MLKAPTLAILVAAAIGAPAQPAQAASCDEHPDQAAAQRAHDTRDADSDGLYCETLRCPCLKPDASRPSPTSSSPSQATPPKLGEPKTFTPVTKTTDCHLQGHLPDPACTPGGYYPDATRKVICRSGYSASVRHVTESVKRRVYAAYGVTHHTRETYEIDHLIPLEAGGSNQIANLFPNPPKQSQASTRRTG